MNSNLIKGHNFCASISAFKGNSYLKLLFFVILFIASLIIFGNSKVFAADIYSITYNLDGGTQNASNPTTYTSGQEIKLYEPTKTGYSFAGWYVESDFSGEPVTTISSTDTGNKTFYAKWEAQSYNINYYYGTTKLEGLEPSTYTYGETTTLATYSLDNYTFLGWYSSSSFNGNRVTKISATDTGDKTYYAKIQGNEYTITYNLNGGTQNSNNANTYTYGIGTAIYEPTYVGYTFGGWYLTSDFSGAEVTEISITDSGNIILYAKWEKDAYEITFDAQDATEQGTTSITSECDVYLPNITVPTKIGYSFKGYYTETDGNGVQYWDSEGVPTSKWNIAANTTLYAYWEIATYSIKYYYGNTRLEGLEPASYVYGDTLTLSDYSLDGYNFSGWYTSKELTGSAVTSISSIDYGDKKFYANLTKITYTVGLNEDGTNNEASTQKFDYSGTIQEFETPITGNYRLEVWGAQGGSISGYTGGYGGYSSGETYLNRGEVLYIVVGGSGSGATTKRGILAWRV